MGQVLHHHTVLTQVLAGHLLLRLPYLGCTTKQGSVPSECLLHMLVQRHGGSRSVFWSLPSFYRGHWRIRRLWI